MAGHGAGGFLGVAGEQRFDNGQMLRRFIRQAMVVVAGGDIGPGDVPEGSEQNFQPRQFGGKKIVATTRGDEIVQAAVDGAGLLNEPRSAASRERSPAMRRDARR